MLDSIMHVRKREQIWCSSMLYFYLKFRRKYSTEINLHDAFACAIGKSREKLVGAKAENM
jgi:hypothetical protein